ncbi:MAG: hypothetical protein ACI86H_002843 [bacterium]
MKKYYPLYVLFLFLLVPFWSYSKPLQSRSGFGPLHFTSQSLFQLLQGHYLHETPELEEKGKFLFISTATWANTWDYNSSRYRFDFESWLFTEHFAYSVTDRFQVSLRFQFLRIGGGVMDPYIEGFHKGLGISNGGRNEFQQNDSMFEAYGTKQYKIRNLFSANSNTSSTGEDSAFWINPSPRLSFRYALHEKSSDIPITLQFSTSLHYSESVVSVINKSFSSNSIGISTAFRYNARTASTVSVAYTRSIGHTNQEYLNNWQLSAMYSLDYQLSEKTALVTQILRESSVGKSTDTSFDEATTEILFGAKWRLSGSVTLEFALVENLFTHDNSVDFAIFGGVEAQF